MASGLASVVVLASQLHAPHRVLAGPPAPVVSRPASAAAAAVEARAALQAAGLHERWSMPEDAAVRARDAGIDEARVARWIDALLAGCLAAPDRCRDPLAASTPESEVTDMLLAVLGEIGADASLPLLRRLDARGFYQAGVARARIHERAMLQAVARSVCAPPDASEIQSVRAGLDDFAVLRVRAGRLVAERPTPAELDDLSYFLAAVAQAGTEVGHLPGRAHGSWTDPAPPSAERERLAGELDAARLRGDLPAMARHAGAYLASLGYPRAVRFEDESTYAWGGARYSYVMRDLAEVSEDLGQLGQAAELYRHADPGGGACGTSVDYRWQEQVEGVIRAEERRGQCRAVVAERLLGIDENFGPGVYGTARLRAAGFDLLRLYRGALVTRHREIEPAELERVLAQASGGLGPAALQRLARRGPEDWARRVHAVRGLADAGQRAALPVLVEIAASSAPAVAVEALTALADLAEKPPYDPCSDAWGSASFSNVWQRPVHSLGRACETHLDARARADLARSLAPFLRHASLDVRKAARSARQRILHGAPE
jgi:hypothetical protein